MALKLPYNLRKQTTITMHTLREDYSRISLELNHEIRYWTQKLQCTKTELQRAVRKVGACEYAVRRELSK